ncbi:MAG: hypothetical protein MUC95_09250, partial [Spirochaetes bacterium]|nr:hypothetical protein [Spirochaetota bacterium]
MKVKINTEKIKGKIIIISFFFLLAALGCNNGDTGNYVIDDNTDDTDPTTLAPPAVPQNLYAASIS